MGAATFGEPKDNRAGIRNQTRTHTQRGMSGYSWRRSSASR